MRDLDEFGHNYGRRITDIDLVTADKRLAEAINCPVGASFLRFVSVRTGEQADDPAVACTKVFINAAYGGIVTEARHHPETLFITFIEELFQKKCVKLWQSIQAVPLPEPGRDSRCDTGRAGAPHPAPLPGRQGRSA